MRIIFLGPPGIGKGTQSARLAKYLDIPHCATGDMIRLAIHQGTEIGALSEQYIRTGMLVPDPVILKMIGERLALDDCEHGFLLDGFPRNLVQATVLSQYLSQSGTPLDAAIALQVDREEIGRRLAGRGREDDQPEIIRQRLIGYEQETAPLLKYFTDEGVLYSIDGMGTPDEVTSRIQSVVEKLRSKSSQSK